MDLPNEGLGGHQEGEGRVTNEASSPSVVRSVESASNLVEVVGRSKSHLPVIVLENVGAVFEGSWVSLCLFWGETSSTVNEGVIFKVVSIETA